MKIFFTTKKIFFLILLSAVFSGCESWFVDDDNLSLTRQEYIGSQLRTDGYYFNNYFEDYITTYFLYRNGVLLYGDSFQIRKLPEKEKQWQTREWQESSKNTKYQWGVFVIDSTSIQFDRWWSGEPPLKTSRQSGRILNDTTFLIAEKDTYHFRRYSPKPDSVNRFIP